MIDCIVIEQGNISIYDMTCILLAEYTIVFDDVADRTYRSDFYQKLSRLAESIPRIDANEYAAGIDAITRYRAQISVANDMFHFLDYCDKHGVTVDVDPLLHEVLLKDKATKINEWLKKSTLTFV